MLTMTNYRLQINCSVCVCVYVCKSVVETPIVAGSTTEAIILSVVCVNKFCQRDSRPTATRQDAVMKLYRCMFDHKPKYYLP